MKYLKQLFIILAATCVGEWIHELIPLPIPGSVYGLLLLFLLLMTHIIPIDAIRETGEFLIEIMPAMFIPAAVGLINSWGILRPILLPVLVITVVSTILVFAISGT